MAAELPCWVRAEGYRCGEGLATLVLCAGCTYMWYVPQCGVSLTQTPFPPSAQFIEPWNILSWRGPQRLFCPDPDDDCNSFNY